MTTITYEERLQAFAEGKRLGQLAKAVRDPEDGVCDACGSALPRTLFALKDTEADRYYFVGQNCLSWLKASGLVARARYRRSAEVAYRKEMENRRNGAGELFGQGSAATREASDAPQARPGLRALRRTFFVAETESHYEAMVRLEDGRQRVSGHAQEPRWRLGWARQDGGVVLLERVPRARSNAVTSCLLKAYRQACLAQRCGFQRGRTRQQDGPGSEGMIVTIERLRLLIRDAAMRRPHLTGRLEKAAFLVLLRPIEHLGGDVWQVESEDGLRFYTLRNGECDCSDYLRHGSGHLCKHRIALFLHHALEKADTEKTHAT